MAREAYGPEIRGLVAAITVSTEGDLEVVRVPSLISSYMIL